MRELTKWQRDVTCTADNVFHAIRKCKEFEEVQKLEFDFEDGIRRKWCDLMNELYPPAKEESDLEGRFTFKEIELWAKYSSEARVWWIALYIATDLVEKYGPAQVAGGFVFWNGKGFYPRPAS